MAPILATITYPVHQYCKWVVRQLNTKVDRSVMMPIHNEQARNTADILNQMIVLGTDTSAYSFCPYVSPRLQVNATGSGADSGIDALQNGCQFTGDDKTLFTLELNNGLWIATDQAGGKQYDFDPLASSFSKTNGSTFSTDDCPG